MSTNYKIIEETKYYKILEANIENQLQQFRLWTDGTNEIRFTDEYARANGFKNIQNMFEEIPGFKENLIKSCGGIIPEWIRIEKESNFIVRYTETNVSFN